MFLIGQPIVVGAVRSTVSAVGSVNVVVTTADGMLVIPNGLLIDTIGQTPRAGAACRAGSSMSMRWF